MPGTLYIVSTPIGNLGDLSARARDTLARCSLILAEDTRVTSGLLEHLRLEKKLLSCHDHNERGRSEELKGWADEDLEIALVADAGTPLVSDPGYRLVETAIACGMQIVPIPGASSILAALVASGLPSERFSFEGFLPDKKGDRRQRLSKLSLLDQTLIFFVPIPDLPAVMADMQELFGNRRACIARELTKRYEEFMRGSLSELSVIAKSRQLKGEVVLVVEGRTTEARMDEQTLRARVKELLAAGGRLRDISSILAVESKWPSSQIYKIGLEEQ